MFNLNRLGAMKAMKAIKAAISAVEEIRLWSFQEHGSLAGVDIGVYVDNADSVGEELIRYDGVIDGAVEASLGYPSDMHDAWDLILDKNFGQAEWEHPAHFAVSVYDVENDDDGNAMELADNFNDDLKKRNDGSFYFSGHLDVVYMAEKQAADDKFAADNKGDKIAELLIKMSN